MKSLVGLAIFSLGLLSLNAIADESKTESKTETKTVDTRTIFPVQHTCVGMDAQGNTIHAIIDPETNTLNVNGDIFKIIAGTVGKNGVSTGDYTTDENNLVYDSVTKNSEGKITLYQFDAKTDKVKATVPMACKTK